MKEYIRAEWSLYKKSSTRITRGLVVGGAYLFLQIFSPFFSFAYCTVTVMLGFLAFCYLFFPLYTTGIRLGKGKKEAIVVEKLLLCLGETKRAFLQVRLVAFVFLAVLFSAGTLLFQFLLYLARTEAFQINNCLFVVFSLLAIQLLSGIFGLFAQGKTIGVLTGGVVGSVCGIFSYEMQAMEERGESLSAVTEPVWRAMLWLAAVLGVVFILVFLLNYWMAYRAEKKR